MFKIFIEHENDDKKNDCCVEEPKIYIKKTKNRG
jgi:hypothetical protein